MGRPMIWMLKMLHWGFALFCGTCLWAVVWGVKEMAIDGRWLVNFQTERFEQNELQPFLERQLQQAGDRPVYLFPQRVEPRLTAYGTKAYNIHYRLEHAGEYCGKTFPDLKPVTPLQGLPLGENCIYAYDGGWGDYVQVRFGGREVTVHAITD